MEVEEVLEEQMQIHIAPMQWFQADLTLHTFNCTLCVNYAHYVKFHHVRKITYCVKVHPVQTLHVQYGQIPLT